MSQAQDLTLFTGAASSSMNDLKSYRDGNLYQHQVRLQVVQDFPMYFRQGILLRFNIGGKLKWGVHLSTTSTGSRASYEDFSGSVAFDQTLKNISLGPHFQYTVISKKKYTFSIYKESGWVFTTMKVDKSYSINGQINESSSERYKSINSMIEYGLMYEYKIHNTILIQGTLGGQLNSTGRLKSNQSQQNQTTSSNSSLTADWSGLRVGLGIVVNFRKRE
jgi:hypothetical protein